MDGLETRLSAQYKHLTAKASVTWIDPSGCTAMKTGMAPMISLRDMSIVSQ